MSRVTSVMCHVSI